MTERSNKKKYPLCAAALALAVLLAGCAPAEGTAVATAQPTAEPTEAPTPTPEPETNPLTGEQGDYTNQRPVAVSIRTGDGSTPQWGIAAADVLIEGVTGHAVPEKIQRGLTVAAFALLFGLMILATYNDILRLITGAM